MSFRQWTIFYRNRKRLKDVRTKLDFSKRRYGILKDATDLAKEHTDLDCVYADIDYHIKVVFKGGASNFFQQNFKVNDNNWS